MRSLLGQLGYPQTEPTIIHMDNQSAMQVAKNPEHHGRMKHMDLRFYWLRDVVEKGLLDVKYIPTTHMVADLLSIPLTGALVKESWTMLGLQTSQIRRECQTW